MCEYYTAAATCAERLSRSNITITSHSQLLSNIIRARKDEAKASLNQQKRQEKEEKSRENERVREEEKERERVKQIKEKWVADVMRLGHKCVLKRGILQDVHKEAWALERQEEDERGREEKMESVRAALARAKARAPAAEKSDPSRARNSRPSSATGSEKSTRERSTQAPKESTAPKQDDIPQEPNGEPTEAQDRRSMLDRVRSWRSSEERTRERERNRLERGRRCQEKLEMWERKWLEAHPGYVSDWDYEGDESREGDGDGDGDGWVGGRGMWEGF